jgi:hypothetical protein
MVLPMSRKLVEIFKEVNFPLKNAIFFRPELSIHKTMNNVSLKKKLGIIN